MNNTSPRHSPDACTTLPCPDDRCVNGSFGIAQTAAVQLFWAVQMTTAERLVVARGGAPSHPVESIVEIRDDLELLLNALERASTDGLRYFVNELRKFLPQVLRLPIESTNQPEALTQRAANFVRP